MSENPQSKSEIQAQPHSQLSAQLSEREIRRQLLSDQLQDRRALLPFGVSGMALIYMLLYAPVLGGQVVALLVFILAGLAGLSMFLWQFVFRYQQNYALKSHELLALLDAQNLHLQADRVDELHARLEGGLSEIKAAEALRLLHKLDHEYQQLQPVLSSGKESDLLSLANLDALVKETYFRGLSVLEDIFELERLVRTTDNAQLNSEIADLQKKAAALRDDPDRRDRLAQINERIQSNQDRMHLIRKLKQRVDELLYQASRCESSLGKARIELVALKADASDIGVSTVTETLRRTIDRAMEVQSELKQMGY